MSAVLVHLNRDSTKPLAPATVTALTHLVEKAMIQLRRERAVFAEVAESLRLLDAQLAAFVNNRRHPAPDATLFAIRLAVQLRQIADQLDGGRA